MKKDLRKVMALVMAVAMFGSASSAFAEFSTPIPVTTSVVSATGTSTGEASGAGTIEAKEWPADTVSIILPTGGENFNFTMDPIGIIAQVGANGKDEWKDDIDDIKKITGGVIFANADTGTYTDTSTKVKVTNKSTTAVDVEVKATYSNIAATSSDGASIIAAAKADCSDAGTTPALYMAIMSGTGDSATTAVLTQDKGATLSSTIADAKGNYAMVHTDGQYTYSVTASENEDLYKSFEFYLKGACNKTADWSKVTSSDPSVNLVWSVTPSDGYTSDGTKDIVIKDSAIKAGSTFTIKAAKGSDITSVTEDKMKIENGQITMKASWLKALIDNTEGRGPGAYSITINAKTFNYTLTK